MNITLSRALYGTLFVGALSLLGTTAAHAADTSGDNGTLSGSQVVADVSTPVQATGNAISAVGDSSTAPSPASASAVAAAAPASAPAPAPATTSGSDGTASGTQVVAPVAAPVSVSGNAISVLGDSSSTGSTAPASASAPAATLAPATTTGNNSLLGGTQGLISVDVPIALTGDAVSAAGDSSSTATTAGTTTDAAAPASASGPVTSGADGTGSGTQVVPVVAVPVTVTGNAISVVGDSGSANGSSGPVGSGSGSGSGSGANPASGPVTSGSDGTGSGTQVAPVVAVPVTVTGNSLSVIGDPTATPTASDVPTLPNTRAIRILATPVTVVDPPDSNVPTDTTVAFGASGTAAAAVQSGHLSSPAALSVTALATTGTAGIEFGGVAGLLLLLTGAALMFTRRMSPRRTDV
ncbi:DUF320 domain-containing protein [Cryobacterium algoricola]|uniref:DUF320 domain-containing protein n=1 Tax=Cryobacterium algoricola TaxID=1259183 RepID=A0ABY2IHJ1_9MICO|nr:chaplin family protein [Cryobacterium algoricola]TFB91295.1 DUF320 domain-containing protein [Cryobacterium algoricola]